MKEYGFRIEEYRGFSIASEHEGKDGEVTGYTVIVDSEEVSELVGEEVGSMVPNFATVAAAQAFINGELGGDNA